MAENEIPKSKLKKLPPISGESSNENKTRPVKKLKRSAGSDKEKDDTSTEVTKENETKPKPQRRKKRSPSQDPAPEEKQTSLTKDALPQKRKKIAAADLARRDEQQNAGVRTETKDGHGSKTSLISQDNKAPRKKKTVKKVRKTKKPLANANEYGDSPWAADLRMMKEDIIIKDTQDEKEEGKTVGGKKKPVISLISAPVLRSQPLDKIFIETSRKFKYQSKSIVIRRRQSEAAASPEQQEGRRFTTIDFAISTHKIFRVIALFLHGLTAGLALWQMAIVFTLATFSSNDFLEHYHTIAMPLQSSYYFLLVICTIYAADRFDVGNPTRNFVLRALTLQNGTVSVVLCLTALILSLVAIRYDDRMNLYKDDNNLYSSDSTKANEINMFKGINAARSILIILSWLILSVTPNSDRLGKNLQSEQTKMKKVPVTERVSSA